MEDVPSRYLRPSVSTRYDPFPRSMMTGSSCAHSCIWVNGCHRYCRSQSPSEGAFFFLFIGVARAMRKRNAGAGAARIIRGPVYFDNPGGSHYNEPILLMNELAFAKPHTQFLDYRPYRSR